MSKIKKARLYAEYIVENKETGKRFSIHSVSINDDLEEDEMLNDILEHSDKYELVSTIVLYYKDKSNRIV